MPANPKGREQPADISDEKKWSHSHEASDSA